VLCLARRSSTCCVSCEGPQVRTVCAHELRNSTICSALHCFFRLPGTVRRLTIRRSPVSACDVPHLVMTGASALFACNHCTSEVQMVSVMLPGLSLACSDTWRAQQIILFLQHSSACPFGAVRRLAGRHADRLAYWIPQLFCAVPCWCSFLNPFRCCLDTAQCLTTPSCIVRRCGSVLRCLHATNCILPQHRWSHGAIVAVFGEASACEALVIF
jgi:hypothetical protein